MLDDFEIFVGKYNYKTRTAPAPEDCHIENVHVSHSLSPYKARIEIDGHKCIIENVWQFSKVYPDVPKNTEYVRGKPIWNWPTEKHYADDKITAAYWKWRTSGFRNKYAVRYPVGFHGRHKCIGAISPFNDSGKLLDYVESRDAIYIQAYRKFLSTGPRTWKKWLKIPRLCINEVDGPSPKSAVLKRYKPDSSGAYKMTPELLRELKKETIAPYGHGYTLAQLLFEARGHAV